MKRKKRKRKLWLWVGVFVTITALGTLAVFLVPAKKERETVSKNPKELLIEYMNHIEKKEYAAMYSMLEPQSAAYIGTEAFIERNSKIYEGIEVRNLKLQNIEAAEDEKDQASVTYRTSFDTVAGQINFENEADFIKDEQGYKLVWSDRMIFPDLSEGDRVKVLTKQARRGEVLDRNGYVLAGKGTATSVGIVPGKLEERKENLQKLSKLLKVDLKTVESKLQAKWVKDDSYVPVKTIDKISELDLMDDKPDEKVLKEKELQDQLLSIPGVMLSDVEVRTYGLGEAAAHLMGYVQGVTAEDLEKHQGEGYHSGSVIGRGGMEGLYEKELKGQDGHEIYIVDDQGQTRKCLASMTKQDGKDIKLTIDAALQRELYEQFQKDRGCSVAMNPRTGEVLALVSTPSYDNNDFIKGMGSDRWAVLNDDEKKPLYNRFRQIWCPGSTFKPVIASIGLETESIDPDEDFGNVGLSWQKDKSWGSYYVTTLHSYKPVTMENALIYSDNIYFAKAALKIGAENLQKSLDQLGFNQDLPFEIAMSDSQYSNSDKIETEIQLADSGYGQGQVLVNPLHLASLYTAFLNNGNVIKPYLLQEEGKGSEIWLAHAFSSDVTDRVLEGLKKVVNDPHGTGYGAHRKDILLAGKTGTAEIKASKGDTSGTEIGWFAVFTADEKMQNPLLIVSMVEDVKKIGGSAYVVKKDKAVLDNYLQKAE